MNDNATISAVARGVWKTPDRAVSRTASHPVVRLTSQPADRTRPQATPQPVLRTAPRTALQTVPRTALRAVCLLLLLFPFSIAPAQAAAGAQGNRTRPSADSPAAAITPSAANTQPTAPVQAAARVQPTASVQAAAGVQSAAETHPTPPRPDDLKITIEMKNVRLEQVVESIKRQSGYLFANKDADLRRTVSVSLKDKPLKEALQLIFPPAGISYEISGHHILLSEKVQPERVKVSGLLLDAAGLPVPGAAIVEQGTKNGTVSDLDGGFVISLPSLQARLEISCLGYASRTVPVSGRAWLEITLQESAVELEGTVVTALGIRRDEKALSYNVQEVKSELLTDVRDANFINALAGKVAGVTINASSSGVGGAARVILRGDKSISQSSNALYVIDGIPMYNFGGGGGTEFDSKGATEAIADLNPDDIESMSVLTGAAAAALYGSEAANGAIMITTRKGTEGGVKATFSSSAEFLDPFVLPRFQHRYGTGLGGRREGSSVYSWGAALPEGTGFGYTPEDYFHTGRTLTQSFSVSGGTDRSQTYLSASAVNSDGIIPNNRYDRYNVTFRSTAYLLHERLRLDLTAGYVLQLSRNMTNQGVYSNPLVPAYLFPRGDDFRLYRSFERYNPASKMMEQFWGADLTGDLRMQNPYWINYRNLRDDNRNRYMATLSARYDFTPWLNLSGRVKIDNTDNLFTDRKYASTEMTLAEGRNGYYSEERGLDRQTYADLLLNLDKSFGRVSLAANLGGSFNGIATDHLRYCGPIRENGLANIFNVMDLDDTKKRAEKTGWHDETVSAFGSVELGWDRMLYLTATGRHDWASQLAGSGRSGFFYPSLGLSWVPTSKWEMKALSYFKLRGSVASVGMPFPRFLTVPTYEYDYTSRIWKDKTHYPITDLKPERTTTFEAGVEAVFRKGFRLNLSWYLADTYNQTFDPHLPPSSSYSTIYLQTGSVRNTGVEATLGYSREWGAFGWESGFTFSRNRNLIRELASNAVNPATGESLHIDKLQIKGLGKAMYILKKGGTLGDLYTTSGIAFNKKGYLYIDASGNITMTDKGKELFLGSVFPDCNLAWRNDFTCRGLRLGFLFSGRIGGICYSATQANLDLYGVSEASARARDEGGVRINGRTLMDAQKWYQAVGSQSGLPQYYTYSATNFRLQEASLSYTLPRGWFREKAALTLSLVGHNLLMLWNKAPFDPEAVATTGNNYQGIDYFMMPSLRSLGFKARLDF